MLSEFLTWESWEESDALLIRLFGVEVIKDFGQMKKGDLYTSVSIFYETWIIEAYKGEEKPAFRMRIKMFPV